jgi:hypothetical protein
VTDRLPTLGRWTMSDQSYAVPLAEAVIETDDDQPEGDTDALSTVDAPVATAPAMPPDDDPQAGELAPSPVAARMCRVRLRNGCYRLEVRPRLGHGVYRGTIRVDRAEGRPVVSGDLYWFPPPADEPEPAAAGALFAPPARPRHLGIPVYPRARYHSYLKATAVGLVSVGTCRATITFEQYDYTQPAVGSFNGSFPVAPGSRTVTLQFAERPAPSVLWPGRYYEGTWRVGGVLEGRVRLGWVSSYFRRCTVEIDTLVDSVAPDPVPRLGGPGTESFRTMLASAGWQAGVVYDQKDIPKPPDVANHQDCWSDASLHKLMLQIRRPTTNLDREWRMHLLVVPGKITCSRGKMYDSIEVPREGVVSYSDDGCPLSHSVNFGTAEDKQQRDVPRAFLRSASHEVVHGFNQIHQEQEGGADNSIMTTTPSVADVLAAPSDPGVFPDDIRLEVNTRVRHHLVHFPDPVVRPGGHTFASWAVTPVPSADRVEVGPEHLDLSLTATQDRIELGEPLILEWRLTNTSDQTAAVPSEVTAESTYAKVTVIDAVGRRREVTPFVIICEQSRITPLAPGDSLTADQRVYWSTNGFAFERPGRYTVEVRVDWTTAGTPLTVRGELPIYVNYPTGDTDNAAASTLLHPDVGKWVALGGGAYHLTEAVERLEASMASAEVAPGDVALGTPPPLGAKALRGYAGILPEQN